MAAAQAQEEPGSERRADVRHRIEVEVTLDSESAVFTGIVRDVSRGGVFVATYQVLPIGTKVLLDLTLPDRRVEVLGEVRWRRELCEEAAPGMGIQLQHLDPAVLASMEALCEDREPLYADIDEPPG